MAVSKYAHGFYGALAIVGLVVLNDIYRHRFKYLRIQWFLRHHGISVGPSVCPGRLALQ